MQALQDGKSMDRSILLLKEMTDGISFNKNPLTEIENPEMRLYGIGEVYFNSLEELKNYCQSENISIKNMKVLDYFRNFASRNDVIRKIYATGEITFYKAVDEYGYGIYNHERSIYRGEFVSWRYKRNVFCILR